MGQSGSKSLSLPSRDSYLSPYRLGPGSPILDSKMPGHSQPQSPHSARPQARLPGPTPLVPTDLHRPRRVHLLPPQVVYRAPPPRTARPAPSTCTQAPPPLDWSPRPQVHPAPRPACRALLSDRGAAALIVLGFLSLPPLLVLASAARSRLARRLRPLLPPPTWTPGSRRHPGSSDRGRAGRHTDGEEQFCAWV